MAVEKLFLEKSAKISWRQNALETIFSARVYISGHRILRHFRDIMSFSTATPVITNNRWLSMHADSQPHVIRVTGFPPNLFKSRGKIAKVHNETCDFCGACSVCTAGAAKVILTALWRMLASIGQCA